MPTIKGTVRSYTDVEVSPFDCLEVLKSATWEKLGTPPPQSQGGYARYINKGRWETWSSGHHGSGDTDVLREATPEEMALDAAFQLIEKTLKRENTK